MSLIDRLLRDDRTRADSVRPTPLERPTRTSQDELAETVGHLRGETRFLLEDVAEIHDEALDIQLDARTDEAAKRSVPELLSELAAAGFAWREIATLVGVTVPAIRKWRQGETTTGAHRRDVARLVAFVDVLRSDHLVDDVSSWMEIPLAGSSITGLDLYGAGQVRLLLLFAAGHLTSGVLLDASRADWRDEIDPRFEVTTGSDGDPIIRMTHPERPE